MATRTITVHDRCVIPACSAVLFSMAEGERGTCASCWVSQLGPEKKKALNRLIASAFNGSTEAEKDAAAKDAFDKLKK